MSAIRWNEEFDDDDNSVWTGASPYTTDSDPGAAPDVYWRLKQRLRNNAVEWYSAHDAELGGETGESWSTLDGAKAACQEAHDNIEDLIDPLECTLADEEAAHQDTLLLLEIANKHKAELRVVVERVVEIFRPMQDKGQNGHTFELLLERAERALRHCP